LLSNKLETDLLMRFAGTTQISQAIAIAGIKPKQSFIVIAIGKSILLKKIYDELKPYSKPMFSQNNQNFIKQQFHITKTQIDSVYSKTKFEDILVEKAAILFG
jgi:tRNA threonylcarbamoyladenosine modification (KEOPS) complex Cgi121 subunit